MVNKSLAFLFILTMAQLSVCDVVLSQEDRFQKEITPENVQRLEAGRKLRRSDKFDKAIEKLQSLTQDQPDYYLAHYNLALTYVHKKDFDEAIKSFTKALEIKQKAEIPEATIYNSIGWAYFLNGDYAKAEKYFLIGIEKENQDILTRKSKQKLFNNIGLLYMYKGDLELSEKYLKQAAEVFGSSLARRNLDRLYELKVSQKKKAESNRDYYFAVIGSFKTLVDATHFAEKLTNANYKYRPEIYLAENYYYGVTLGGYLGYDEAIDRVVYARSKGIAKDAYVWKSKRWGKDLFK